MVHLTGFGLTLEEVEAVACQGETAVVDPAAVERMQASRRVVDAMAAGDSAVYAVNTGVGLLADTRIPAEDLEELQTNVVRSHCCGIGPLLPVETVRAMMLIRANVLAMGYSGIRPLVAERLCDLLNRRITPVVPSRGSVGASGDLAPLAHVALALIGEGDVLVEGRRVPAASVVEPLRLASKEGISLVNGTQAMLAIGVLQVNQMERLLEAADVACALTIDALEGTPTAFDSRIHSARPHVGQGVCAANLRRLLSGSEIRRSHVECRRVQDAYSLRCAPQVHGAVRDSVARARDVFGIELNSATDNPLVFGEELLSGGNFHGQPLALELDYLAIAMTALGGISERRIERLVNPALSEGLPAFLATRPGLESGMMMLQVSAAALAAENRVLATPASPGSITTSGNKEDFVSMGMTSALKLVEVVANVRRIIAMELVAASRALRFRQPLKSSPLLEQVLLRLPVVEGDQPLTAILERLADQLTQWQTPESA